MAVSKLPDQNVNPGSRVPSQIQPGQERPGQRHLEARRARLKWGGPVLYAPGMNGTGAVGRKHLAPHGREKLAGRCHRQVGRTQGEVPRAQARLRRCRASREGRSGGGQRATASQEEGSGGGGGVGGSPAAGGVPGSDSNKDRVPGVLQHRSDWSRAG